MTTYTNVPKPSNTNYVSENPAGRAIYDDPNVMYDDPNAFYDAYNPGLYTNVTKPSGTVYTNIPKP